MSTGKLGKRQIWPVSGLSRGVLLPVRNHSDVPFSSERDTLSCPLDRHYRSYIRPQLMVQTRLAHQILMPLCLFNLHFSKGELRWGRLLPFLSLPWADEVVARGAKVAYSTASFFEIESLLLGIADMTALRLESVIDTSIADCRLSQHELHQASRVVSFTISVMRTVRAGCPCLCL